MRCQLCGRCMDAHWNHGHAGYRCRHGHTSADSPNTDQARNLYFSEVSILDHIAPQLTAQRLLDEAEVAAPDAIASALRATQTVVLCRADGVVVQHDSTATAPN